ncbi:MAG: Uma2 family endonuclease [Isosphaeraceae bacterium]
MSTVDRAHPTKLLPPLENGQQLDQPVFHERYAAMPPETRAELVGGVVYMPSPMSMDHGRESRFVSGWMDRYERFTPGIEGADGATVKLDRKGEPQPDHILMILHECGGQTHVDENGYCTGAPELVAEISRATRSFDLNRKKADYERAGVCEYLVVELGPDRIHWFILRGGRFEDLRPGRDRIYRSKIFPGLWLDSEALFTRDRDRRDEVLDRGIRSPGHAAFVARLARAGGAGRPR